MRNVGQTFSGLRFVPRRDESNRSNPALAVAIMPFLNGQKDGKLRITFRETDASKARVWRTTDHVENYDTGWTKRWGLSEQQKPLFYIA
jgi:hypothetical protein